MIEVMNVHAAKTNLSKLLARVANGEEIVIAKDGVPVAKLVPYEGASPRPLGVYAGKMWMSDDAFETPAWLVDAFEGIGGEDSAATEPSRPLRVAEPKKPAASPKRKPRKR